MTRIILSLAVTGFWLSTMGVGQLQAAPNVNSTDKEKERNLIAIL